MSQPLIGVCINTQNEGPRVKGTVRAFHEHLAGVPHEIIVCDDAATDGCCADLGTDTIVIRNETQLGCGRSKRRMTEAATADILCFVDAHQAPFVGSMAEMARRMLDMAEPAVVSPLTCRMEFDTSDPNDWRPRRSGSACLAPNEFGLPPNGTKQYRQWTAITSKDPCRMIGVGVMVRRRDLLGLGGWCNFEGRRGSQERGLTLKAFMAGYDILIDPKCVIGHEFAEQKNASRKGYPYPATSIQDWAKCQWHAWAVVLEQATFEREIMPVLLADKKSAYCPGHHLAPHVVAERDWFAANAKKRSDDDLLALIKEIQAREAIPADTNTACMEPAALAELAKHARGRCLEFGSGEGVSAKAILASSAVASLVSIDHSPRFTEKARAAVSDPRAMFLTLACPSNGAFYDVKPLLAQGVKYDFILLDGPPGTAARRQAIPAILPLLADGGVILVDDAKRDDANIQCWRNEYGVLAEMLLTHCGLCRIEVANAAN